LADNAGKLLTIGLSVGIAGSGSGIKSAAAINKAVNEDDLLLLSPLPYSYDALEPYLSATTLKFHHDKHHAKYVATTLEKVKGTELEGKGLLAVMKTSFDAKNQVLFNNAAQVYNHALYWRCMKSGGGGMPTKNAKLLKLIDGSFGSYDEFRKQFASAGNTQFGSGWAWLVLNGSKLEILKTSNAENPLLSFGLKPILTMDVWEHAYVS
jgi:superoxide dismutase, Fe-Mn family